MPGMSVRESTFSSYLHSHETCLVDIRVPAQRPGNRTLFLSVINSSPSQRCASQAANLTPGAKFKAESDWFKGKPLGFARNSSATQ